MFLMWACLFRAPPPPPPRPQVGGCPFSFPEPPKQGYLPKRTSHPCKHPSVQKHEPVLVCLSDKKRGSSKASLRLPGRVYTKLLLGWIFRLSFWEIKLGFPLPPAPHKVVHFLPGGSTATKYMGTKYGTSCFLHSGSSGFCRCGLTH